MCAFIHISILRQPPPQPSTSISPIRIKQCFSFQSRSRFVPSFVSSLPSPTQFPIQKPSLPLKASIPSLSQSLDTLTSLFPLWVTLSTLSAYIHPPTFLWFGPSLILPTLSIIMLGMGLTISSSSFLSILRTPHKIFLGALSQYTIMPLLAFSISRLFSLPPPFALGFILVGVCPGGASSNLVCLIARADVALSVLLTLVSTLCSVVAIPLLMQLLAGALVPVSPMALFKSAALMVLTPLIIGATIKTVFPAIVRRVTVILPLISVICVACICGGCVAANAGALASIGMRLIGAVAMLHGLGGLLGYMVAKAFGMSVQSARTVSIEVMMQNSTMAVSLANLHFGNPVTAVPGAISAVMHSVLGSVIAGTWRLMDKMKGSSGRVVVEEGT